MITKLLASTSYFKISPKNWQTFIKPRYSCFIHNDDYMMARLLETLKTVVVFTFGTKMSRKVNCRIYYYGIKFRRFAKTYEEILSKGITIEPPRRTDWGGEELLLCDSDGNNIIII